MVCACGYDESRNYEKYPTFGLLPGEMVSAAGLWDRRKNLIHCGGCGHHGFFLNHLEGKLCCLRCSRVRSEVELKPLRSAMGWQQPPVREKKPAAPQPGVPVQAAATTSPQPLLKDRHCRSLLLDRYDIIYLQTEKK